MNHSFMFIVGVDMNVKSYEKYFKKLLKKHMKINKLNVLELSFYIAISGNTG